MDIEDQKFMALEGLHAWASGILDQVRRIEAARESMGSNITNHDARIATQRAFNRERHFFLIAAYKLVEYADWASNVGVVDKAIFSELFSFRNDIKGMRDKNEHVVAYFLGRGHDPSEWVHVTEEAIADASSTVGSKIGGRLDWNEVANVVRRLTDIIPPFYHPNRQAQ